MSEKQDRMIWKVRTVKDYPEAHNHLFIGEVIELNQSYVRLDCRTFHFGKITNTIKDVRTGSRGIRILPWYRIELINELPDSFNYAKAEVVLSEDGKIALKDGKITCILTSSYDMRK